MSGLVQILFYLQGSEGVYSISIPEPKFPFEAIEKSLE